MGNMKNAQKTLPLVSIIMPVYNAGEFLEESIDSILNQTFQDWEFIICDDKSSDHSADIIRTYSDHRIVFIENEYNIGYLKSINELFDLAKGEFIAFQDADDISHPRRIELQYDRLRNDKSIILCGTNDAIIDTKSQVISIRQRLTDPDEIDKKIKLDNCFQKPSIMFDSKLLKTVGGYRKEFLEFGNISEDYDWLVRISEKYKMTNVVYRDPLYKYRSVPTSMSKDVKSINQFYGHDIVRFLYQQRMETGKDAIMTNELSVVKDYLEELKKPYEKDSSLFFREKAYHALSCGLHKKGIYFSMKALLNKPMLLINYRLLRFGIIKYFRGFKISIY